MHHLLYVIIPLYMWPLSAQSFPPAAGFPGSTAIHADSSVLVDWAIAAHITRGYKNSAFPENGFVDYGVDENATGIPDGNEGVVSLGDDGYAVLSFNVPIVNGQGPDFAVFENGFRQNDTTELAFLELAFVDVSTDGVEYIRFPSISEIPVDTQTDTYENLNARLVHNLAGKYTMFYGTPFDLDDLEGLVAGTSVNLSEINYIKITALTGSINDDFANYDSQGNKINDPYPTPFSSGGFDLDAVGVINNTLNSPFSGSDLCIIQNPVTNNLIFTTGFEKVDRTEIISLSGKLIGQLKSEYDNDVSFLDSGVYILKITGGSKSVSELFIKM